MDDKKQQPGSDGNGLILGLTHLMPYTYYCHDSSVAMVAGGKVIAAVAEERFTRVPHYAGYSACALNWLFQFSKAEWSDIQAVALPWPDATGIDGFSPPASLRKIARPANTKNIVLIDHQRAHAFSTYAYAPFEFGTVLCLDGIGMDGNTFSAGAIYDFTANRPPKLRRLFERIGSSLGEFYGAVTQALGWEMLKDEGKTMALAALGDPRTARKLLEPLAPQVTRSMIKGPDLGLTDRGAINGHHLITFAGPTYTSLRAIIRQCGRENTAAAAQAILEDRVLDLAGAAAPERNENLCLAGGLFLNIHLVRRLREEGYRIFAYPNPGDGGTAVGAALASYYDRTGASVRQHGSPVYLGPEFSESQVEAAIRAANVPHQKLRQPTETAAELLRSGQVLGIFQGRAEWGPRALGNRSVLADPRDPGVRTRINSILKKRESFQPFGPMMTEHAATKLLQTPYCSPFMIDAFKVTPRGQELLGAAIHVDGTVRAQILRSSENPFCFDLLRRFEQRTGVAALINTSLNIHGKSMCLTPEDAHLPLETRRSRCPADAPLPYSREGCNGKRLSPTTTAIPASVAVAARSCPAPSHQMYTHQRFA
jgi:carbamoyltransferase